MIQLKTDKLSQLGQELQIAKSLYSRIIGSGNNENFDIYCKLLDKRNEALNRISNQISPELSAMEPHLIQKAQVELKKMSVALNKVFNTYHHEKLQKVCIEHEERIFDIMKAVLEEVRLNDDDRQIMAIELATTIEILAELKASYEVYKHTVVS